MSNKTHLQTLDLTLLEIHEALKDADFATYVKTRNYITLQLVSKGVSKGNVNVWWSRILADLKLEYHYSPPHSPHPVAKYNRAKRIQEKKRVQQILKTTLTRKT